MSVNLENTPRSQPLFLYGSISCGADTWSSSLGKGRQVFSFDSRLRSEDTFYRTSYYRTNWSKYPNLDLLLVQGNKTDQFHEQWMTDWWYPSRARNILVIHRPHTLTAFNGKGFNSWSKVIRGRGYNTHTWHVNAVHYEASIYASHLVKFCYPKASPLALPPKLPKDGNVRACRNLIRTYGIPSSHYHPISRMKPSSHPARTNWVGTLYGQPVYQWDGNICSLTKECWILVPEFGIRRVQVDELEKLKGLSNSRYNNVSHQVLLHSVEQHVWEVICKSISQFFIPTTYPTPLQHDSHHTKPSLTSPKPLPNTWTWTPPDLTKGQQFYNERVHSLKAGVDSLGLEMNLPSHRV